MTDANSRVEILLTSLIEVQEQQADNQKKLLDEITRLRKSVESIKNKVT